MMPNAAAVERLKSLARRHESSARLGVCGGSRGWPRRKRWTASMLLECCGAGRHDSVAARVGSKRAQDGKAGARRRALGGPRRLRSHGANG